MPSVAAELGIANVSTGLVGLLSLAAPGFVLPVAPVAISAGFSTELPASDTSLSGIDR
jgi:hypothetical protein